MTGFTRQLEGGDVTGKAVPVAVVCAADPETSRVFTVTDKMPEEETREWESSQQRKLKEE